MRVSDEAAAAVRRKVALTAVDDARVKWRRASKTPTPGLLRQALRACVLASVALLRASEDKPEDELAMIEQALLLDESAATLKRQLSELSQLLIA